MRLRASLVWRGGYDGQLCPLLRACQFASKPRMRAFTAVFAALVVSFSGVMSGCYSCSVQQNPEKLREKTADTTAALKQDAKAVAQGVREGLTRDHGVDINTATPEQLAKLPGVNDETARRIVANRPYSSPQDLLRKHVLSRRQYDQLASRIKVGKQR